MTSKFRRATGTAAEPAGLPSRTAVYRHIEQDIRARVSAGPWSAGMMIPSRKNLAQEYGVDLRTVQRAISALLSDGTLVAQGGRGTFVGRQLQMQSPDPDLALEKNAVSGARLVIGVAVNQLVNPAEVAPQAISGAIHSAARQSSPEVRVLTLDSYADSLDAMVRLETEAFNVIEHEGLSGAIVWHSGGERTSLQLKRIVEREIPLVLIDRYTPGLNCDFVGIDNVYSAIEAVRYLLSLGHVRIGFLAPLEQISAIDDRLTGYRKALSRAGIALRDDIEFRPGLADSLELASLRAEMEKVVERIKAMPASEAPTAIFAVNDVQAHHLINALEESGISVPARISVIGFDDIDRFSPRPPFLTTMRQSFEDIGERAADLLLERIRSRQAGISGVARHILLPARLVARQSCAAPLL